ncbi:hypothetical protein WAI453_004322 [Rhynchosporium graminicola]|uniref:Uncharacterized protein n=1 Tax=Rhynchosporium graminicola TaxID=2792576 RepID=A0A1E1LMR2_9HELO|nr:uncharacterized protein RCO7_08657 [Rhynchosporium commune]
MPPQLPRLRTSLPINPARLPRQFPLRNSISPRTTRNSSSSSSSPPHSKIDRLLNRLPKFLHPYTRALRTAPVSHLTSFLILHEITAIIPLLSLAAGFHYLGLGEAWVAEGRLGGDGRFARGVNEGVERFGRYFGRKGWFGFEKVERTVGEGGCVDAVVPAVVMDSSAAAASQPKQTSQANEAQVSASIENRFHPGERGTRILIEVATAYAITKVLLPARILVSVWAAPWFARVVLRNSGRIAGMMRGRGSSARVGMSGAAGTGATGGGVGSWSRIGGGKGS